MHLLFIHYLQISQEKKKQKYKKQLFFSVKHFPFFGNYLCSLKGGKGVVKGDFYGALAQHFISEWYQKQHLTCWVLGTRNPPYSDQVCKWQFVVLEKETEALAKPVWGCGELGALLQRNVCGAIWKLLSGTTTGNISNEFAVEWQTLI